MVGRRKLLVNPRGVAVRVLLSGGSRHVVPAWGWLHVAGLELVSAEYVGEPAELPVSSASVAGERAA